MKRIEWLFFLILLLGGCAHENQPPNMPFKKPSQTTNSAHEFYVKSMDFWLTTDPAVKDSPFEILKKSCETGPETCMPLSGYYAEKMDYSKAADYAEKAFARAVEDNDYAAVETLFSKKVRIPQHKASELLWYIVGTEKNSNLISLLVNHAQADVNYTENGKMLLVAAVEKNNTDMVRVLLDQGAIVDRVIDGEKNTALTIAMKNKYRSVAQLLREYGA